MLIFRFAPAFFARPNYQDSLPPFFPHSPTFSLAPTTESLPNYRDSLPPFFPRSPPTTKRVPPPPFSSLAPILQSLIRSVYTYCLSRIRRCFFLHTCSLLKYFETQPRKSPHAPPSSTSDIPQSCWLHPTPSHPF